MWEQGQRTAKWLEGSGTHLKVSLRPDCGYEKQLQEGGGGGGDFRGHRMGLLSLTCEEIKAESAC